MKALIIGASGFVGSNLTERLFKKKWKVRVLVRSMTKLPQFIKKRDVSLGDISDYNLLAKATKGIDVVFNCAGALPHHRLSDIGYRQVNVDGVKNILEVIKGRKIKLVHLSTVGIYTIPRDIYALTKLAGEELIKKYQRKYKTKAVIIRPTIAYGPGDTRPGFLNLFILIKKGMFISIGPGDNYFQTIYVGNLIDALILAATKSAAVGEDFIVGDYPCPTMKRIVKRIAEVQGKKLYPFYIPIPIAYGMGIFFDPLELFGLRTPLNTRRVKFMTQNRKYSIEKAQKILGFKPKINLFEGIKRTFDWYKKEGLI